MGISVEGEGLKGAKYAILNVSLFLIWLFGNQKYNVGRLIGVLRSIVVVVCLNWRELADEPKLVRMDLL